MKANLSQVCKSYIFTIETLYLTFPWIQYCIPLQTIRLQLLRYTALLLAPYIYSLHSKILASFFTIVHWQKYKLINVGLNQCLYLAFTRMVIELGKNIYSPP